MKNYINFWIAAFVFLLFSFEGKAQCPPGNLNFTHQQDVDNFAIQYPGCTQIAGTLTIEGSNITNLNGLSNITTIGGDLRIWHTTQLPDMEGLNGLTLIEGDLNFFNNSGIQRMDGLESLARIGANFDFYINPALQDLSALRSLGQIGGFLQLAQSPQLADISALQHIDPASIGGSGLHITDNANLAVCNLPNFCTYLSGPGPRNIYGNKTTCLNTTAVTNACSVACPAGDVTFTTQEQVNDFGAMYAHCTDITLNSLTIGFLLGSNATDITDLTPLQNISSINGTLYIYNNPLLSDLNGLNGLMEIGGLNVYKNATLENINALNSITQIGGVVNFDSNPHLQNLDGLSSVENIGGYLYIAHNDALTQLNGLSSLQSIGAFMEIRNNPSLTSENGLNNLTSIGGHLSIRINNSLTNLNGLSNLTSIGGHLSIQSNAALTDISGLQNIDPETITGANGLSIITNPNLSVCNLPNFCAYLQGSGPRTISGNKTTCLNEAAVQAECAPCETPGNLSVEDLHSSTVTLAWEGEAEHFELEWGTAGFGLGNGSPVAGIEETSYPLSGLSANTAYEFYVRADCGNRQSEWAGPFGFTTLGECPSGSFTFTTQQQIDDFAAMYAHCTDITLNNLTIGFLLGSNATDITNLDGLSNVTHIQGDIIIRGNGSLTNLDGLSNVTHIQGDIIIRINAQLTNLDGLSNVTNIVGTLIIENNALTNINGLSNVTNIGGRLIIENNDALTNINGLSNVTNIGGRLIIENNDELTNINGLSNVTHIQGDIIIRGNAQLTNLDGLSNVTNIVGWIHIDNNLHLENLDGLANVTNIGGTLIIENNDALTNINGLANFTHIQGDIIIWNNGSLTDVDGLSGLTNITSSLGIGNNDSLSHLNGLSGITNIVGNLTIDANSVMTNIDGLNNLTSIGGYLTIQGNAALTDISGLQNIDPSTIGGTFGLRIVNNPLLAVCNLPNFCAYLQGSGPRAISGNAGDCISEAAVLDACDLSGNCDSYTLWDGFVWSNGLPDSSKRAIIDGDFVLNADLEACELEVTTNGSLEIPPGITLTVYGTVANYASAGEFIVSNDANLIQSNEAENSGSVTVKRESNPMIRLDYTLWSSPVVGQNLFGFSPETVNGVTNYPGSTGRIYVYEGTNGYVNPDPFTETAVMNGGTGYLFRAPNNWSATEPEPYIGVFTGVPNNGNIVAATYTGNYTSIGNPYPSNITLDEFFTVNPGINAVYFWNNNHSAGNNYAACTNGIGCVAAAGGGNTPGGIITPGQGFIVHTDHSSVTFTNEMRTGDNGTFFKVDELESHRFWLNLNGENEKPYNQVLVGYVSEATNGVDNQIDGKIFGYEGSALYSIIENEKLVIQGRALPFEASDVVPLGFKAAENGKFKISLANFDGLFAEGPVNIYLKDNELNIAHNLMVSAYDFESNAGEFNERFEIIFGVDGVMGMDSQDTPEIQIYTEKDYIVVDSKTEKILSVELYGLEGKSLYRNDKVNAKHYKIKSSSFGPRVLVVKTKTINGETLTKKIINK